MEARPISGRANHASRTLPYYKVKSNAYGRARVRLWRCGGGGATGGGGGARGTGGGVLCRACDTRGWLVTSTQLQSWRPGRTHAENISRSHEPQHHP
eukprot:scaffold32032_cov108-Isochrysis_galbana.AAC.3